MMLILMPLILTCILGAALGSVVDGGSQIDDIKVGYVQTDQSEAANMFKTDVLEKMKSIKVTEASSEDEIKKLLDKRKSMSVSSFRIIGKPATCQLLFMRILIKH